MSNGSFNWEVETIRMTAFFNELFAIDDKVDWWSEATGESPEESTLRPKDDLFQVSGAYEDGSLKLQVNPVRVDWLYSGVLKETQQSGAFVSFRDLHPVLDRFQKIISNWFERSTIPPINRIAFGVVLISPVEGRVEGYKVLDSLLPVEISPEDSSDFMYQINRPRPSASVAGMLINRLSKWSVAVRESMQLAVAPDTAQLVRTGETAHALRLELDINTSGSHEGKFPKESSLSIFRELIDLGIEISQRGDIS